jgi:hypothetical protein
LGFLFINFTRSARACSRVSTAGISDAKGPTQDE